MSVREYIGARYVPLFMGEWDNSNTYEPLSIVMHEGNSYTSRQAVPAGIAITNEVYWAETGNYNAQVETYRQEVLAYAEDVEEYAQSVEGLFDAKLVSKPNITIRWRDAVYQNYFAANMPANAYSTMQGLTETENTIIFTQNPASYWGHSRYVSGLTNTLLFTEVSKANVESIIRSQPVPWNHGNSMAYDKNRNVIYVTDMYRTESDSSTTWLNTISIYDYATLSKLDEFTIPGSNAQYYDGVSYDAETDTIAAFSFDKFSDIFYCYILKASDKTVIKSIRLTECESLFAYIHKLYPDKLAGNVFQSGFHTDKYLAAVTFHPNAVIFMDYDGHIIKVCDLQEHYVATEELEDVSFDKETGTLLASMHKRYYNRKTTGENQGEVHCDIETICELNLYTDIIPDIKHEVSDGFNIIYVDPSTTNKIHVGSQAYPFKYAMEALNTLEQPIYHPRIYYVGSGLDEWVRIVGQDISLIRTTASEVNSACVYTRNSACYLENLEFVEPTAFLKNLYNQYGDVYFLNDSHAFISSGHLPTSSSEKNYVVVDKSICSCQNEISANAAVAFRFTNAAIGAVNSNDATKSTASGTCLVNFS